MYNLSCALCLSACFETKEIIKKLMEVMGVRGHLGLSSALCLLSALVDNERKVGEYLL